MPTRLTVPSPEDLESARERFAVLLARDSRESDWQKLFAECPYILSEALPLRLEAQDIRPLGRPGRSEPDFIFYSAAEPDTSAYGVIELKRPQSEIITVVRRNLATLTRDAETAIAQASAYVRTAAVPRRDRMLLLGDMAYTFVIMGLSSELVRKLSSDVSDLKFAGRIPAQCQIIPYDILLSQFEKQLPKRFLVLVPSLVVEPECHSCFISYSWDDHVFGTKLRADLRAAGVSCWQMDDQVPEAAPWPVIANEAIRLHEKVIVILSQAALGSAAVLHELSAAFRYTEAKIVPIVLDGAFSISQSELVREVTRRGVHDFSNWRNPEAYFGSVRRLLKALEVQPREAPFQPHPPVA